MVASHEREHEADKVWKQIQLVYEWMLNLSVPLFLLVCSFALYQWVTSPVRELSHAPGVSMRSLSSRWPQGKFDVHQIEIQDTVVSADLLRPALDFPFLTGVFCYNCRVEPEAVAILSRCAKLEAAAFIDCTVDVGNLIAECAGSKTLQTISFRRVSIERGDFRDLHLLPHLKRIVLSGSDIDGDDLRDIAKAPQLRELFLEGTSISDDEIVALVDTDIFESIYLENTNLTEAQFVKLCGCRHLKHLNIGGTQIPPSAIKAVEQSPSLRSVFAAHTPLGQGFYEKYLSNGCVIYGFGGQQDSQEP
jgi:hypothetical protein